MPSFPFRSCNSVKARQFEQLFFRLRTFLPHVGQDLLSLLMSGGGQDDVLVGGALEDLLARSGNATENSAQSLSVDHNLLAGLKLVSSRELDNLLRHLAIDVPQLDHRPVDH